MRKEKNRGITLIALIITIIVMLILVAVSINIAIKSGLFEAAGKAVKDTKTELDKEQKLAGGMINVGGKIYASIDDYLEGKAHTCGNSWSEWVIIKEATETESGEKERTCLVCGKKEKVAYVKNLIIGAPINYHEYIEEDGIPFSTMPSYTSPKEKTGNTEDQEFKVTNNSGVEWIVLGEENGQIKITTKNVLDFYRLVGKTGYVNFIEELNKIGSIYGKGEYADTSKYTLNMNGREQTSGGRSFKMEDLGFGTCERIGYRVYALEQHEKDKNPKIYTYQYNEIPDGSAGVGSFSKFEYMNLDANPNKTEIIEDQDATWNKLSIDNPYVTMYLYSYPGEKTLTSIVAKTGQSYWLASRYIRRTSL